MVELENKKPITKAAHTNKSLKKASSLVIYVQRTTRYIPPILCKGENWIYLFFFSVQLMMDEFES